MTLGAQGTTSEGDAIRDVECEPQRLVGELIPLLELTVNVGRDGSNGLSRIERPKDVIESQLRRAILEGVFLGLQLGISKSRHV